MQDRRTAMDVRRDLDRFEGEGTWGFGTLLAVIAACFVVLGALIYMFGEDQTKQTASNTVNPPRSERTINAPAATTTPGQPSTTGQGAK